ncbi:MAG: metallophosphoesterase [Bacteroidota bacterium]
MMIIKKISFFGCLTILLLCSESILAQQKTLQLIWTSDTHFGLTKPVFRNDSNVSAANVNAAMVAQMNKIPITYLPKDNGSSAGELIGSVEAVIVTGDICNRQEVGVQTASISWSQFEVNFISKLHLMKKDGSKSDLLLTPGNHDISNAIGFHRPMEPLMDNSSLVGIYNLMMHPSTPINTSNFSFERDKIHYSQNIGGVHFIFVSAWPDSSERVWIEHDLKLIPESMPSFIFTHSDPNTEARFFRNPNGDHSINPNDKFENLVVEIFKDGQSVKDSTKIEQRGLVSFFQSHKNIKAYFHGHTNYAEYYDWVGPDQNIHLPCFRSDSPMKGRYSSKDQTKLSFNIISIDTEKKELTVRECFWNAHPLETTQDLEWGMTHTISY